MTAKHLYSEKPNPYTHIPRHPRDFEKYLYIAHRQRFLSLFSLLSVTGVLISTFEFFRISPILFVFFPFWFLVLITFVVSIVVQGFGRPFDPHTHDDVVNSWKPKRYPSVDIFLPVCGEDIRILKNTWEGVKDLKAKYKGETSVYCLDDADDKETSALAKELGFIYLVRDNRGHFKKAGNLRHGFNNSKSEFIAIFDADFRPRSDFLDELLPYFDRDSKLGIVQSPQYFDVHKQQGWLERGAGSVQEYFYRSVQQNRQTHDGAICVGSNAIYRREALASNGGTTLIEHSEDVHTGFDLRKNGWGLLYLPVVLAKGTCPNNLKAFFRQQYRWCRGSMSLLGSEKFWTTKLKIRSRLCYVSGFLYYIQTGLSAIVAPLIPLSLLFLYPHVARLQNYILLIPAFLYSFVIFPMWHKCGYRFEAFSIRLIYSWSHLFALVDSALKRGMAWQPTGSANGRSLHYSAFRFLLITYSLGTAIIWTVASLIDMATWNFWNFLPVFISGVIYLVAAFRIVRNSFAIAEA
jgi:cellulose synthase (UDP-forming)